MSITNKIKFRTFIITALLLMLFTTSVFSYDLKTDIEKVIALEGPAFDSLSRIVLEQIEIERSSASALLLPYLSQPGLTENGTIFIVVALGQIKADDAIDNICQIAGETESQQVRGVCFSALTKLNQDKSAECLIALLDKLKDETDRFGVFNALAEMKYEKALPLTVEILKSDANNYYWKPIFLYGKMGDMAIPFLLEHINNNDMNARYNAINLLGQWLITSKAIKPLEERFWIEDDANIQNLILSSIEQINPSAEEVIAFMKLVKEKSKNENSKKFAAEAIKMYEGLAKMLQQILMGKDGTPAEFEAEYKTIWDSYGIEGDYDRMFAASDLLNEATLKKLKERILLRNSDEAFDDYKKVNRIISMNRLIYR